MLQTVKRRLLPWWHNLNFARYCRNFLLPRASAARDYYVPSGLLGHAGIELHVDEQLERLRGWRSPRHAELFRLLRDDETINVEFLGQCYRSSGLLHNGWYPTPDAEIYAAMILDFAPAQIIEVGSGFSTLIARKAITFANCPTRLTVIDPAPRTDVSRAADEVVLQPVEDSGLVQRLEETSGKTLLFIDSSHVTRARGDVSLLYCQVLPALVDETLVHVHDIFTPYDYPTNYDHLCWTEQYVLQALLAHAPHYRTVLSTHYLSRAHASAMQQTFGPEVGRDPLFFGASYWFKVGGHAGQP